MPNLFKPDIPDIPPPPPPPPPMPKIEDEPKILAEDPAVKAEKKKAATLGVTSLLFPPPVNVP